MFSKKIKTVFDVGASEGTFLRAFANNKSYKVYAFEPIIEKAYALAGRWDNVHVLPISIDECESWREFFLMNIRRPLHCLKLIRMSLFPGRRQDMTFQKQHGELFFPAGLIPFAWIEAFGRYRFLRSTRKGTT